MEGYGAWRVHADSLLGGTLKPQGLDLNYALKGEKAKGAVAAASSKEGGGSDGGGLGWRGWTRIFTFSAAAACGTLAVMKYLKAEDETKELNRIISQWPNNSDPGYVTWYDSQDRKDRKKTIDDNKNNSNIFGAAAGVFAVAGALTFVF
jgi:hypothetical protein